MTSTVSAAARLAFTTTALIALPVIAHAQIPASTLPTVVVTPTRAPMPITQIASSMTVIDEEEITRENKTTVAELLKAVPGLTVATNGAAGQTARVFMRGTNSNHVLVLLDGMALNDPSDPGNAFDFANLTTNNVERVEILRGAQSTMYGSQAIGGVINIITKKGGGEPRHRAFAEYGRYDSVKLGIGSSGVIGQTSYGMQISGSSTDGISALPKRFGGREKDGSDIYTLALNTATKLTENFTGKLNLRYNRTNTEFDSPGSFLRPWDDRDPINDSRQFNGRAAGELSLLDGKWTQELGISTLNLNRAQISEAYDPTVLPFGESFFARQQYKGWRETVDWVHHLYLIPKHAITVGFEAWSDHYKSLSRPILSVSEQNVDNKAIFIDDQFAITDDLSLGGGVRSDWHQTFGREVTWKLGPSYYIRQTGTRLRATYGTGFKAPSLSQLFDPASGNPNLRPEKSKGWDAGFEQKLFDGKVTFGATYFKNNIDDLINSVLDDPGPPAVFRPYNTSKARTEGVEATISVMPAVNWTVTANYTYTQADDRISDTRLLRRPKHRTNMSVTYDYSAQGSVGANLRYQSASKDFDINFPYGITDSKGFTTIDLNASHRMTDMVTLYGRLENLFDKRYEEVFGYGQPGRGLYGGLKVDF